MVEPLSSSGPRKQTHVKLILEHHPTFFVAVLVAATAAIALKLVGVPAPWPAAVALYVHGAVSWPVLREQLPALKPSLYAAAWVSAALLVVAYETLAAAAH